MLNNINITSKEKKDIKKFLSIVFLVTGFIYIVSSILCFFTICFVQGESMQPTYDNESVLFGIKNTWFSGDYKKGDVISFDNPANKNEKLIKRIIAIEGDHLIIKDGKVIVNGKEQPLYNSYNEKKQLYEEIDMILGENEIFVLGDNRIVSIDSRVFGTIKIKDITSKMLFKIF